MIEFATLPPRGRPNRYLMLPAGLESSAPPDETSPDFALPAAQLFGAFKALVLGQPRITWVAEDGRALRLAVVQRTALFRFPDEIHAQAFALDGDRSVLAILSRSKYGYTDLGANRRRVQRWLWALQDRLGR